MLGASVKWGRYTFTLNKFGNLWQDSAISLRMLFIVISLDFGGTHTHGNVMIFYMLAHKFGQ
jgi:hypothetical protein